ncbi:MAG: tripartite tricarboxylate transporter substrate binding protein [Betaproteobacteria bacterium]|nr:tripartite tricarboxylate transporter substrate binding protein [Betaproteobacteria bacterium]
MIPIAIFPGAPRFARVMALSLATAMATAAATAAQPYPTRPVRIVIPLSPGGTTDVPGRLIAQRLPETLGQPFIVDNRPGAGGIIGADSVAKAKPDGYTLLLTATPHVITPGLYKSMPYNALADFAPVIRIASGPYLLAVHPSLGVGSVRELIALAKSRPGKIDFASSGNGSAQHLVGALFARMAGIDLSHVPYKGSGPATTDLLAGVVKVGFPGTPIAMPHIKAGRLRALGVTTAARLPQLPEVPTIAEAGVPGYEALVWVGLLAPAGTPADIIAKLNAEIAKLLRLPEVQQLLAASGVEATPTTPEEFGVYLKSEFDKWQKVVLESGAQIN